MNTENTAIQVSYDGKPSWFLNRVKVKGGKALGLRDHLADPTAFSRVLEDGLVLSLDEDHTLWLSNVSPVPIYVSSATLMMSKGDGVSPSSTVVIGPEGREKVSVSRFRVCLFRSFRIAFCVY